MNKWTNICLLWLALFASGYGSVSDDSFETGFSSRDGAFYTEDAIVVTAHVGRQKRDAVNSTRDAKQLLLFQTRMQSDEGSFGTECESTIGKKGYCMKFRECYPLVKVADTSGWDGWVMGHYDTCSYINGDNMEVFGVCCTKPVSTPPQQEPDVQRIGILPPVLPVIPPYTINGYGYVSFSVGRPPARWDDDLRKTADRCWMQAEDRALWRSLGEAYVQQWINMGIFPARFGISALSPTWASQGTNFRQIPAQWPPTIPPLPTHPPDHAAPTHPPPMGVTTKPTPVHKPPSQTTWATRPPSTSKPTTKQTWQTSFPTQSTKPTQPAVTGCGAKNGPQAYGGLDIQDEERIVGGHNAELNEWPWIVGLFNNGRQFCGGSLIDDRHVLSAAHCVAHMTSWDVARLTARLGDYNIRTPTETQHIERKIKRVVRHRGFDMRTLYNDISILTIDQPVTFTKNIHPICLPGGSRAYAGLVATVIGWGSLRESGPQPSVLQEVSIPIWTNAECRLKYGAAAPGGIVEHMICAGKASMDSCSGDSGGPLMVNEGGKWNQVGVVSWGIGCGKGQYPGVYTRVTAFLPWIQKNSM